jgi:hypothetical protein
VRSARQRNRPASRQLQDKVGGVAPAGLSLDRAARCRSSKCPLPQLAAESTPCLIPPACRPQRERTLFRLVRDPDEPLRVPPVLKFTFVHFSGTKSRFPRDLSAWDNCMRTCNARQTDQVGEPHGRSLSRHRRYWHKLPGRDGAGYRLYVKGRLGWRPLSLVRRRGVCMSSPKYHREQAKILAGLALSTPDATKADHFKADYQVKRV